MGSPAVAAASLSSVPALGSSRTRLVMEILERLASGPLPVSYLLGEIHMSWLMTREYTEVDANPYGEMRK